MIDSIMAVVIGFFAGLCIPKRSSWDEQRKIYEARLQDQANIIDYYKKLTKKLVTENMELRREQ